MKIFYPSKTEEAIEVLSRNKCIVFAGGTDLVLKGGYEERDILCIEKIQDVRAIEILKSKVRIGAGVTISELCDSKVVTESLKRASENIAAPAIKNYATIGGNIINASPAADLLPVLYNLETVLELKSFGQKRKIELKHFINGPGSVQIYENELLTSIEYEKKEILFESYFKVGTRNALSISKVSFNGIVYNMDEEIEVKCSFGSVGPRVVYSETGEEMIKEFLTSSGNSKIEDIIKEYSKVIVPISDKRSSHDYRKAVAMNLLRSFILNAGKKINESKKES